MSEEKQKKTVAPKKNAREEARGILRHLQGEDGYEIFADRSSSADRERWLRDYEDERK